MLTYDAGALIAAERRHEDVWALHEAALLQGFRPVVPSVVLAQVWRGGPQPVLSKLLKGCIVEPLTESGGRAAGAACTASATSDVVDAVVMVSASGRGDAVLTSDPADLQRIVDALAVDVVLHAV